MADEGIYGQSSLVDSVDDYHADEYHTRSILATVRTAIPVKIVAVYGPTYGEALGKNAVVSHGFVDVRPLIKMQNGIGDTQSHGTVTGIPWMRTWCGNGGIIHDPVVGDKGALVVCDRDISVLKKTLDEANPGSRGMHEIENGVYVPNTLEGATPKNYMQFRDDGVNITVDGMVTYITIRKNRIFIETPDVWIDGNLHVTGEVTAGAGTGDQVSLRPHVHPGTIAPIPEPPTPTVPPHPEE